MLIFPRFAAGQRCSTMEAEKMRVTDARVLPGNEFFESWIADKFNEERSKLVPFGTHGSGDPDLIPVVVHVIHNGEAYGTGVNITDEQIFSQIAVLNEDFKRLNADTIQTQIEFLPFASSLNIEFVLARQDENGLPTTGIVRARGPKTTYNITISDRELLSEVSQWDPNIYLNIWVTDLSGQNIGLAQFPDYGASQGPNGLPGLDDKPNKSNEATDGMVIDYQAFGSVAKVPGLNLKPQYNLGRSATHEMGHFLGLLHVWGDGGCSVDDFVDDTPNSDKDYLGNCNPVDFSSCGTNDMYQNFLYYTDDACMNIFSAGQVGRMEIIMQYAPRRASLLNSIGTIYPESFDLDLAITSVTAPGKIVCEGNLSPAITIRNNGGIGVTNFGIELSINGDIYNYDYIGDTIRTGQTVELFFDEFLFEAGNYQLSFELNGLEGDMQPSNNSASHVFAVNNDMDFIPLREQFNVGNLEESHWTIINDDSDKGWEGITLSYVSGLSAYINLYNYENRGQNDWLISPLLDFSEVGEATLKFKTSYAKNSGFNDQLQVLFAGGCEGYFNNTIRTYNSDELSVTNSSAFWQPASRNDWKEHTLALNQVVGKKDIRIAFRTTNDFGNNLYLDDIEFYSSSPDDLVTVAQNSFTLYPNPTFDGSFQLAFNTSGRQRVIVQIYDQLGKIVSYEEYENTLNQIYYYNFLHLAPGIYYINALGEDFSRSKKLLLSR